MARPIKKGLDYFPLDTVMDEKIELLEAEYGIKGFGVVVRILQKIYGGKGYYIEFNEEVGLLFSKKIGEGWGFVSEVIGAAIKRDIFNREIYEQQGVLTSQGIQRRYIEACSRRKEIVLKKSLLLLNVSEIGINVHINGDNVYINPQSKVKESKVINSYAFNQPEPKKYPEYKPENEAQDQLSRPEQNLKVSELKEKIRSVF